MNWDKGWRQDLKHVVSNNFNARPPGACISLLVIHNISLPPKQFGGSEIEQFFTNTLDWDAHPYFDTIRGLEVSAHFLVKRSGEVVQFVSCDDRAWHAGQSSYCGAHNCNDYSIGVELEGADDVPYTRAQYEALVSLTRSLMLAYPSMAADHIVGHSDIAPGRKTDPGPAFDWAYFHDLLGAT